MDRADRLRRYDQAARPIVTPSLLDCDLARMADVLAGLERADVAAVHLDVMDGAFVPNLSYGPPVVKAWRAVSDLPFDAHLMMREPARYLDDFVAAGCDAITVHIEVLPDPGPLLRRIRAAGCRAGLSLNPPTPVESVLPWIDAVDSVLVMSVMPGFGGQAFDASAREKIRTLRAARADLEIAVDGGIKASNTAEVVSDGATQLVVGSGVFRHPGGVPAALAELAAAASAGRSSRGDRPA